MSIAQYLAGKKVVELVEFTKILSQISIYSKDTKIAVAVSGGADSLCLALMLKEWSNIQKCNIIAIIVDHNLRLESGEEAKQVQNILKNFNIDSVILTRNKQTLQSKIQKKAREDRYNLLIKYCKDNNIFHLFIGHHLNDLLETILMRRLRKNDIIGSAGISMKLIKDNVILLRPLLYFTKQAIINTVLKFNVQWIEDASNKNEKFERTKVRNMLKTFNNFHISKLIDEVISNTNKRITLEKGVISFIVQSVTVSRFGQLRICSEGFKKLDKLSQVLMLRLMIKFIGGNQYMPKIQSIEYLINNILNKSYTKISLGNTIITRDKEQIFLVKEARNINNKLLITGNEKKIIWDNRFCVILNKRFEGYNIHNISEKMYNHLLVKYPIIKEKFKECNLNKDIMLTLPWLFINEVDVYKDWYLEIFSGKNIKFYPYNSMLENDFFNLGLAKT